MINWIKQKLYLESRRKYREQSIKELIELATKYDSIIDEWNQTEILTNCDIKTRHLIVGYIKHHSKLSDIPWDVCKLIITIYHLFYQIIDNNDPIQKIYKQLIDSKPISCPKEESSSSSEESSSSQRSQPGIPCRSYSEYLVKGKQMRGISFTDCSVIFCFVVHYL